LTVVCTLSFLIDTTDSDNFTCKRGTGNKSPVYYCCDKFWQPD